MGFSVQAAQVTDITSKWELAQRISGDEPLPEQALKSIFKGAMEQLEVLAKTKFETPMKDRVWDRVSGDKLKALKETFILEFCERLLGSFDEEKASAMLEEHKRTGTIRNMVYSSQLQIAFALNQSSIIDAVVQKANSMTDAWLPEIVDAVRHEGVELPEPAISVLSINIKIDASGTAFSKTALPVRKVIHAGKRFNKLRLY